MAGKQKKQKGGGGNGGAKPPTTIPHKDHYARISYLYQTSALFSTLKKYQVLSRNLARNVDLVSKKTVLKLTPAIKRNICKRCNTNMIAGITMKMSVENKSKSADGGGGGGLGMTNDRNDVLVHECLHCGQTKRFPIGKDREYRVFSEKEEVALPVD